MIDWLIEKCLLRIDNISATLLRRISHYWLANNCGPSNFSLEKEFDFLGEINIA